ncbi:MAG: dihydropteroate synthase [bacterium]|nr:dihydropteroate synthase [bacterium]
MESAIAGPMVMGIVNVTPDSFSDGAQFATAEAAVARGRQLFDEGAAVVDVGGESTRPGAEPVPVSEELARVVDVVAGLAPHGRVSIDTTKPEVARAAVAAGAGILNDVSASLQEVAAELNVTWIAVHRQGTPGDMQDAPRYADVVAEVGEYLAEAAERGRAAGVPEVWIDPGIGFGKTTAHNLELLANLRPLILLGTPVVVGASRKRFIGELHSQSDGCGPDEVPTDDRLEGSLAAAAWAFAQGASVVRAHDVAPTVGTLKVVAA